MRTYKSFFYLRTIVLIIGLFPFSGCLESKSLTSEVASTVGPVVSFEGCVDGVAMDTSRINVTYAFPAGYPEFFILRDGVEIYSSRDRSAVNYTDSYLNEGQAYTYECGVKDIVGNTYIGNKKLKVSTDIETKPLFAGIKTLKISDSRSLNVGWGAAYGGAQVEYFKVYYNPGTVLDWSLPHKQQVSNLTRSFVFDNMGDEIPYVFGVRACTVNNTCDANITTLIKTLPNAGAPLTSGIGNGLNDVSIVNGEIILNLPWNDLLGGVKKRHVYQKIGGTGSIIGTDLISAGYTEINTLDATANIIAPPTYVKISNVLERSTYHFVVRDEDPSGLMEMNTNFKTVGTGDLTPPNFGGIHALASGLTHGIPSDTSLIAEFSAIDNEDSVNGIPAVPTGATWYLVYLTSVTNALTTPADPCLSSAAPFKIVNSSLYVSGNPTATIELSGLTPRTNYRVCIKAKDAAGNISTNTNSTIFFTKDITAPTLTTGVPQLSYNGTTKKINVLWNNDYSANADLLKYQIHIWDNTGIAGHDKIFDAPSTTYSSGVFIGDLDPIFDFPITSGSIINITVNMCDDAAPNFNAAYNCTTSGQVLTLNMEDTIPPTDFPGIATVVPCTTSINTCLKVTWAGVSTPGGPALNWADYSEFVVYKLGGLTGLEPIKIGSCLCDGPDCSGTGPNDQRTSCEVTNSSLIDVARNYKLIVTAKDSSPRHNETITDITQAKIGRSGDADAPYYAVGASGLVKSFDSVTGLSLSWFTALDNQFNSVAEPLGITYTLYEKVGTLTFSSLARVTVEAEGTPIYTGPNTSFVRPKSFLLDGNTYNYTVCAQDFTGNKYCNGTEQISIVDTTSPQLFDGVATAVDCAVPANGCVKLTWALPVNRTDYRGFKLSTVEGGALTNSTSCTCGVVNGAPDCVNSPIYSCEMNNLTVGKVYNYFVQAFDAANNYTNPVSPFLSSVSRRPMDITKPNQTAGLSVAWDSPTASAILTWQPASDNDLINSINYKIYRSLTTDFTRDANNIPNVAVLTTVTGVTTYSDLGSGLIEGATYYYTVCAVDFAGNQFCNGQSSAPFIVPDLTPPTWLANGLNTSACTVPANGCIKTTWLTQAWDIDHAGFKVYTVDASNNISASPVSVCQCTNHDCATNPLLSCEANITDAGVASASKTVNLIVTAYDKLNNNTSKASAMGKLLGNRKTGDIDVPNFPSAFSATEVNGASPGIYLLWSAANDNQFVEASNFITYKVYKKMYSTFTMLNGLPVLGAGEASLITTTFNLNYTDPKATLSAGDNYYLACAFDYAQNPKCDTSQIAMVMVADVAPPSVTGLATTAPAYTYHDTPYNISWTMSDNLTSTPSLLVKISKKLSDSGIDYPTLTDPAYATTVTLAGNLATITDQSNPFTDPSLAVADHKFKKYANYRITVTDMDGNATSTTISILLMNAIITNTNYAAYQGHDWVLGPNQIVYFNATVLVSINSLNMTGGAIISAYPVTGSANILKLSVTGSTSIDSTSIITGSGTSNVWSDNLNIRNPVNLGGLGASPRCGGSYPPSGWGGSALDLTFNGPLSLAGKIQANGVMRGSAGSVLIKINNSATITSTAYISANGGVASGCTNDTRNRSGLGGRIAFYYTNLSLVGITLDGLLHATQGGVGAAAGTWYLGNPGTIYYKDFTEADGHLRVDSENISVAPTNIVFAAGPSENFSHVRIMNGAIAAQANSTYTLNITQLDISGTGSALKIPSNGIIDSTFGAWFTFDQALSPSAVPGTNIVEY